VGESDVVADLHRRAAAIRTDMGGADKVARMRAEGDRTVREHIDGLLDDGSFDELGTFSWSMRAEDRDRTPGDGKIGGHGTIDGRPVAVFGDDITVLRGS
jgi:acetyl-CoA carboxylase carboxyltransferase component